MGLLPKQRIEMAGGKYLLRSTEHYAHIQVCIEDEDKNGYEPISLSSTETIIPGSDVYYILFKRIEKKKTKAEAFLQVVKNQQP